MTKLIDLSRASFLLAGALVGLTLGACDLGPKTIGQESQGDDDVLCKEGETKPDEDGCNTCKCLDGGWACTAKLCDDEGGDPVECMDGEMKTSQDGCSDCTCVAGEWLCTLEACPLTTGGYEETGAGETGVDATGTGDTVDPTGQTVTSATGADDTGAGETGAPSVCGDGIVEGAELCDDGNLIDDDACPNDCGVGEDACGPKDPLTIEDAKIAGDALVLDLSYGGGCETHDIGLCWDGSLAESDPVQTWFDVSHDGHDDNCDAWIQEQRQFDLSPQKLAWQQGYQMEHGTILVHVAGWGATLEYTF